MTIKTQAAGAADVYGQYSGIDRAWSVAVGAAIYVGIGIGPIALFTFGVFVGPIIADTGWDKATVAAAIGPATILLAIGQPIAGLLADKYGMRRVALLAAPILVLCLAAMAYVPQTATQFALLFAITFFLGAGTAPPAFVQAVSHWFDRHRGVALSILFAGASVGIAVLSPLSAALIDRFGWRMAYVLLATLAIIVQWLTTLILLKDPPHQQQSNSSVSAASVEGLNVLEAVKTKRFWVLFVAFIFLTAGVSGGVINFPVIMTGRGFSPQQAAFTMTIIGVFNLLGRLAMGVVLDRMFSPLAIIVVSAGPLLAFLILGAEGGDTITLVAAALLGFGLGAESDALAYITSRAFGRRSIGVLYGLIFMAYGIGAGVGPALLGVALQKGTFGSSVFFIAAVVIAISMVIMAFVRRPDLPYVRKA